MTRNALRFALLMAAGLPPAAPALTIEFDYSFDGGFFSGANLARRTTLEAAGGYVGGLIGDRLLAIESGGDNDYTIRFLRPDTGTTQTFGSANIAADTLRVYVGGRAAGGTLLGEGGPGDIALLTGSDQYMLDAATRGQAASIAEMFGPAATDFAPWGGAISFNSAANWYFDPDPVSLEGFTGNDFFSAAVHELAHVLGFATSDSWNRLVVGNVFTGPAAVAANGGAPVPLTTDQSHWANGTQGLTLGTLVAQEAALDPSLATGTRKYLTGLDAAALVDAGWEIALAPQAVPVPAGIPWLLAATVALLTRRRIAHRNGPIPARSR
ncbi:MAG: peptidase M10A and M12B matrixin and adamalysin [Gammaproteobacteria bacterium]